MQIQITQILGANIRKQPTTQSEKLGTAPYGQIYDVSKKTPGENVGGNNQWYELTVGGYIHTGAAKDYYGFQPTIYSQNDLRWKFHLLGLGSYLQGQTIGNYGCALTCCSMLSSINPWNLNDYLVRVGGFVQQTLLAWNSLEAATMGKLSYKSGVGIPYNNDTCYAIIKREGACIVQVQSGIIPMHFVVAIGGGKIIDPIDGKVKPFDTYEAIQLRDIHISR